MIKTIPLNEIPPEEPHLCNVCGLCNGQPMPWIMCRDQGPDGLWVCGECFLIWHDEGIYKAAEIKARRLADLEEG